MTTDYQYNSPPLLLPLSVPLPPFPPSSLAIPPLHTAHGPPLQPTTQPTQRQAHTSLAPFHLPHLAFTHALACRPFSVLRNEPDTIPLQTNPPWQSKQLLFPLQLPFPSSRSIITNNSSNSVIGCLQRLKRRSARTRASLPSPYRILPILRAASDIHEAQAIDLSRAVTIPYPLVKVETTRQKKNESVREQLLVKPSKNYGKRPEVREAPYSPSLSNTAPQAAVGQRTMCCRL